MKLTMGIYEVEIKAKSVFNSKFNKEDTESLLTSLMIALSNSAVYNQSQGLSVSAQRNREMMENILEALNQ